MQRHWPLRSSCCDRTVQGFLNNNSRLDGERELAPRVLLRRGFKKENPRYDGEVEKMTATWVIFAFIKDNAF